MTLPQTSAPDTLSLRYAEFWHWFSQHEQSLFHVVKAGERVPEDFFEVLSPALDRVKEGFYMQTGMFDDATAELIISAEGAIENIGFVEELIGAAPALAGWKFTALKTATDIKDTTITMGGFEFNTDTLTFYSNVVAAYPDEIDLVVAHKDYTEEHHATLSNGVYIFLETYLGELDFAISIDQISVMGAAEVKQPLVPIEKLKDFLMWRQKEFVEKYEGLRHQTDDDTYATFEAERESGDRLVAIMNTDLLAWDAKASHPWVMVVTVPYEDTDRGGMPDEATYALLNELEDALVAELSDAEGYLNLGRETADNQREIYFACQDFRKPSKVLYDFQIRYADMLDVTYVIYKDKYWQSFERFAVN